MPQSLCLIFWLLRWQRKQQEEKIGHNCPPAHSTVLVRQPVASRTLKAKKNGCAWAGWKMLSMTLRATNFDCINSTYPFIATELNIWMLRCFKLQKEKKEKTFSHQVTTLNLINNKSKQVTWFPVTKSTMIAGKVGVTHFDKFSLENGRDAAALAIKTTESRQQEDE